MLGTCNICALGILYLILPGRKALTWGDLGHIQLTRELEVYGRAVGKGGGRAEGGPRAGWNPQGGLEPVSVGPRFRRWGRPSGEAGALGRGANSQPGSGTGEAPRGPGKEDPRQPASGK